MVGQLTHKIQLGFVSEFLSMYLLTMSQWRQQLS
jgi:hypothetical protein